jgi:hypothetical protein
VTARASRGGYRSLAWDASLEQEHGEVSRREIVLGWPCCDAVFLDMMDDPALYLVEIVPNGVAYVEPESRVNSC